MKKLILPFFLALGFCPLLAQPITMYKTFGNVRFEMDTLTLSFRQVSELLSINPKALQDFKTARTNYNVAGLLGFSGSLLVAIPVITAIAGGQPEWGFAAGGAALILSSIPFSRAFKIRATDALDNYNSQFPKARLQKPEVYFSGRGLGVRVRF
jgi:hypothetical protein